MPDDLKTKTLHGLFWSFLECGGQQAMQFVISIILARLLLPAKGVADRILTLPTYYELSEEIAERICLAVGWIPVFCGLET